MKNNYFQANQLVVGYHGKAILQDVSFAINRGEIVTLVGQNGAGKSTILKSIARQLKLLGGRVLVEELDLAQMSPKNLAMRMAVMFTDRKSPEQVTCWDVAALGRYPYTGRLGILGQQDKEAVEAALLAVGASEYALKDFAAVSDGQRQRVLLARALCQEPEIIVLDEPMSFLDVKGKIELSTILQDMAASGITVILSLHETELAQKLSDKIICVGTDGAVWAGTPGELAFGGRLDALFGLSEAVIDPFFGSFELAPARGEPKVFVISSSGAGIPVYRRLQRERIPFAAGILYENDIDYRVAKALAAEVVTEKAFEPIGDRAYERALELVKKCKKTIVCPVDFGAGNTRLKEVIAAAEAAGKAVICDESADVGKAVIWDEPSAAGKAVICDESADDERAVNCDDAADVGKAARLRESDRLGMMVAKGENHESNAGDSFVYRDNRKLKRGYTTGSCAAAAAGAAVHTLLTGEAVSLMRLTLPGGEEILIPIEETQEITTRETAAQENTMQKNAMRETASKENEGRETAAQSAAGKVCCIVKKDAGDDPDITDGMSIVATVEKVDVCAKCAVDVKGDICAKCAVDVKGDVSADGEIDGDVGVEVDHVIIVGGEGVGKVTRPGLDQPPGEWAINSVPRAMIRKAVEAERAATGYRGAIKVTISIPGGKEVAAKTFNPRLGIEGGLSILGTTGIVEPMSDSAVVETMKLVMKQKLLAGEEYLLAVPGNYGRDFVRDELGISPEKAVLCSNYVGDAIDIAAGLGAKGLLICGHIGKLCKIAAGIMNTHSRVADGRQEVLCSCALMAGATRETALKVLFAATTEEALHLLAEQGLLDETVACLMKRIDERLSFRAGGRLEIGAVVFANDRHTLGQTSMAGKLVDYFR